MARRTYELYYAGAALIAATALYWLVAARDGSPASSGLTGHSIGVLGFLMMLSTETLYSLRKRVRRRAPGRLSTWLQVHIFTGIVGPYLVLLHTAWQFRGLAGAAMLLTAIVVASGFIGRYIYTAIPRTLDGAEVGLKELELASRVNSLVTARRLLSLWLTVHIPLGIALFTLAFIHAGAALYYATLLR